MFLTVHTSAALLIATKITNPILGFILGIISHFILDIIPHGEEKTVMSSRTNKRQQIWAMFRLASIDAINAIIFLITFLWQYQPQNYWLFIVTVFGAWLPDLAWGSIEFFKLKSIAWILKFHHKIHDLISWDYPLVYGLLFQLLFMVFMISLIFV